LTEKLQALQEFQYAHSGMQRNIQLTQDLTYATSGAIGGLETLGYVTYEQSEAFRKAETVMQLMLIPYELYNILNSYAVASEIAHTQSLIAQTTATNTATTATWGLNTALLANPITIVVVAVVVLVAALLALEAKFGLVTKGVEAGTAAFKELKDIVDGVTASIFGLGDATHDFVEEKLGKLSFMGDLIGGGGLVGIT